MCVHACIQYAYLQPLSQSFVWLTICTHDGQTDEVALAQALLALFNGSALQRITCLRMHSHKQESHFTSFWPPACDGHTSSISVDVEKGCTKRRHRFDKLMQGAVFECLAARFAS